MARYSLRNKSKIEKSFGKDFAKWLMLSLDICFMKNEPIIEHEYEGEKYKIIHVSNYQPNTDSCFELYVISKTYDIYNLAYKSCFG